MYKLLIAEDVRLIRLTLERSIPWGKLGIELLASAENGEEALTRMEQEAPDLLLTDIGMPGMNGLELIEAARARFPDIQCLILSGLNEFEHARRAIKLQVLEYVLKPLDPAELETVITRVVAGLDRSREERLELELAGRAAREKLPHLSGVLDPAEWSGSLKKVKLAEQALEVVTAGFRKRDFALADVAGAVGLSERYLNQVFKEVTGTTINHVIIRRRMEEAARLLKDPRAKIYEVCDRIGYADQDHFRESFKKQFGLTPTEYRNRYL